MELPTKPRTGEGSGPRTGRRSRPTRSPPERGQRPRPLPLCLWRRNVSHDVSCLGHPVQRYVIRVWKVAVVIYAACQCMCGPAGNAKCTPQKLYSTTLQPGQALGSSRISGVNGHPRRRTTRPDASTWPCSRSGAVASRPRARHSPTCPAARLLLKKSTGRRRTRHRAQSRRRGNRQLVQRSLRSLRQCLGGIIHTSYP